MHASWFAVASTLYARMALIERDWRSGMSRAQPASSARESMKFAGSEKGLFGSADAWPAGGYP